jgi:unspecific monooxygenase
VSTAEVYDSPVTPQRLVPPTPPLAPDNLSVLGRIRLLRENPIATWGRRAYQEDLVKGSFFGRGSFILNTPDAIKHVLIDNY